MTLRFYRHGDILAVLAIIEDPIYLAEPWIMSRTFQLSAMPLSPIGPPCVTTYEGSTAQTAPHYLPEKNPFVDEMTTKYGVPRDAAIQAGDTVSGVSEENSAGRSSQIILSAAAPPFVARPGSL